MIRKRRTLWDRIGLTNFLILLNVFVFLCFTLAGIFLSLSGQQELFQKITSFLVLNPTLFFQGYFWTIITSMFMHANFTHLFVNMLSFFFLGQFVEKLIGRRRFLMFYLISGVVAGLFFVFFAAVGSAVPGLAGLFGTLDVSAVGASGALFGLGGLLAVLLPRMKVLVFFVIPMPLWAAMAVLMFGLWALSAFAGLPVGNTAHFGGLVAGLIYGVYLRTKFSNKVRMLNRMFGA